MGLQVQGRDKTRQSNATIIAEQLEKYYQENGEYPSIPALVGQSGMAVKAKLGLTSADVLVLPNSPQGSTNSFTQSEASQTQLAYNGESAADDESDSCQTDINGGCDKFNLQWESEAGEPQEIPSRHTGRFDGGSGGSSSLTAPSAPTISVGFTSPDVVATVSAVTCAAGTNAEYKIIGASNTNGDEPVFADWSTISWQTSTTKSVTASQGTHYYFKAIARCVNGSGASEASDESEVAEYYYATTGAPVLTATISGTTVSVTVGTITCPAGSTAKYQIYEKKDTTTAAGAMAVISTRNFTTTSTYSTTAGAATSPTRHTFRAYTRCDSGTSQGVVSPASADATVVSAPAAPVLSKNTTATSGALDSITWNWTPGSACPVGTSVMYSRIWTGDYTNAGTGGVTTATTISLTTSSQGYQYGMQVRASCGSAVTDKVLYSAYSSNQTYVRNVTSEIWAYKGSIRTRRPDPSGTPNTVFGQAIVHATRNVDYEGGYSSSTPNLDYPAVGYCASGLTRKIQWQWALDSVGSGNWGYNDTSLPVNNGAYSPESTWANGTSIVLPSGSTNGDFTSKGMIDLDKNGSHTSSTDVNNSKVEFAFRTRCVNATTGRAGPLNRADPFGNLTVVENTGKFHVYCDANAAVPWCRAWHSKRNPLSDHVGEWAGHDIGTGTCIPGGYPTDKYCFSADYNSNSAPWGW